MKISLLVANLSSNCLGRAYLLASVLRRRYKVEIVGPKFGKKIWDPCNTCEFEYKVVEGGNHPFFFLTTKLLKIIDCDVIYACKCLPTSFGVGLFKKWLGNQPLVLDIDDWEFGFYLAWRGVPLSEKEKPKKRKITLHEIKKFVGNTNVYPYTRVIECFTRFADDITVVSNFLQQRFGGVNVPHGKDTNAFNPENFDRDRLRKEWNVNDKKIIMFMGTPYPHKGVEDILSALKRIGRHDVYLMMVGVDKSYPYVKKLVDTMNDRLILVEGYRAFSEIPMFLSMADLVVLPQKLTPVTVAQIPGKIFDAMAMAKPIISTTVSDIPEILDGCGIVVKPDDTEALAKNISYLLENEDVSKEMGTNAREKCIKSYSFDAMERTLVNIFDKYR